jgi:alpha-L-fucosidase
MVANLIGAFINLIATLAASKTNYLLKIRLSVTLVLFFLVPISGQEIDYQPSWNSLQNHEIPAWFKDAKFGIYTHWGIYSVPAKGPNGSWYPHNMYKKGTELYNYHVAHYGLPSQFGYKDFITMFKAEKI